jgi:hypothetical protein
LLSLIPAVVSSNSIVDLYEIDPTHDRPFAVEDIGNFPGGRFVSVEPGKDGP